MHTRSQSIHLQTEPSFDSTDNAAKSNDSTDSKDFIKQVEEVKRTDEDKQFDLDHLCHLVSERKNSVEDIHAYLNESEEKINIDGKHSITDSRPIYFAAEGGNVNVLSYLITYHAANLDASEEEKNLVEFARDNSDRSVLAYVLSIANLPQKLNDGTTQLHLDILANQEEKVFKILNDNPEEILKINKTNLPAFWWIKSNDILLERLLDFTRALAMKYFREQNYEALGDTFKVVALHSMHQTDYKDTQVHIVKGMEFYLSAYHKNSCSTLLYKIAKSVEIYLESVDGVIEVEDNLKAKIFMLESAADYLHQLLNVLFNWNHTENASKVSRKKIKDKFILSLYQINEQLCDKVDELNRATIFSFAAMLRKKSCYQRLKLLAEVCLQLQDPEKRKTFNTNILARMHKLKKQLNVVYETSEITLFQEEIFNFHHERSLPSLTYQENTPLSLQPFDANKMEDETLEPKTKIQKIENSLENKSAEKLSQDSLSTQNDVDGDVVMKEDIALSNKRKGSCIEPPAKKLKTEPVNQEPIFTVPVKVGEITYTQIHPFIREVDERTKRVLDNTCYTKSSPYREYSHPIWATQRITQSELEANPQTPMHKQM